MRSPPAGGRAFLTRLLTATAAGASLAGPAAGQAPPGEQSAIVVTGQRVPVFASPERTVLAADVETYGLGTIGELLDEIANEEGDSGGQTAILIDGRLATGISAIEDYPVEAVERIEILPPGSAGRVGGSPTARAYNVVLRSRTRVLAARAGVRAATEGGWTSGSGELGATFIKKPRRINVTARGSGEGRLLESERDIEQLPGSLAGLDRWRSLRPERNRTEVSLAAADRLAPWLHGSLTMKLERGHSLSRLGLSFAGDPLSQRRRSTTGTADLELEADWGNWLITANAAYREDRRRTSTGLAIGMVRTRTTAANRGRSIELVANGPLIALPAGSARVTLGGLWNRDSISGRTSGNAENFVQTMREARVGIDLPIASKAAGFLAPLGELGIGAELRRGRVSGLGAISSDTVTMQWEPAEWLRAFGSISFVRSQPSVDLLAAPSIETPGVRYFDPRRSETVDVVTVSGGNPELERLRVDSRRLSLRVKPLASLDLVLNAEYLRSDSRNIVAALPPASELLFETFPERFTRDPGGRLIRVDIRPLSFDRQTEEQLQSGINLNLPLNSSGEGERGARLQLTAAHTLLLASKLVIGPGSEPIDLLSRRSAGLGGAGRPRHQFDLSLGFAERGLGLRLSAERRSVSYLDIASDSVIDVLTFKPLTTFGLRAFAEGSRLLPGVTWLKGARFSLTIVNLTNARENVRDRGGLTPLSYQPAYRDPLGRTIELEIRKTF